MGIPPWTPGALLDEKVADDDDDDDADEDDGTASDCAADDIPRLTLAFLAGPVMIITLAGDVDDSR